MNAAALDFENWRWRRSAARAAALSILLHLLLIFGVAAILQFEPPMRVEPKEEPTVEITFVEPPPVRPREQTPYLATTEAQRADRAPDSPAFESDKNPRAASELPAEGALPLPTQAGEELPAPAFENQEYTEGREARESSPPAPAAPSAPSLPEFRTQPVDQSVAPASEIALLQPARPQPTPMRVDERQAAKPSQAAIPRPAVVPGFQPQTRVTRLKGGITNRGRAAADAAATPLGSYKKQISDAIGSRWYYYVNQAVGLLNPGTVEIRFVVRPDGGVERVQVLRNSSNESFASTSVRAVMDAEIPPIPDDVRPMLQEESIEVDFTFTILSR
ncbi:MAG: TonB family protein [Terrimicrobiaceae bacterium]|nr:TonB family protein [Terrimicrobiaceae bacterium]